MILDLSAVSFCDSTGLRDLLSIRTCEEYGHRVKLIPSPSVDRVLTLAGVKDRLPLI